MSVIFTIGALLVFFSMGAELMMGRATAMRERCALICKEAAARWGQYGDAAQEAADAIRKEPAP